MVESSPSNENENGIHLTNREYGRNYHQHGFDRECLEYEEIYETTDERLANKETHNTDGCFNDCSISAA